MTTSNPRRVNAMLPARGDTVSAVQSFARIWASAIAGTSYVPMSGDEVIDLSHPRDLDDPHFDDYRHLFLGELGVVRTRRNNGDGAYAPN